MQNSTPVPENPSGIVSARDPLAPLFQRTEAGYDQYLRGDYNNNYLRYRESWEEHYANVREATLAGIFQVMERQGKQRKDMTMALIGPGFDVARRDLGPVSLELGLQQLRSIAVVDFSCNVVRDAMRSLMTDGKVDRSKVVGVHFDITSGLSTVYEQFWRDQMEGITTEEQLLRRLEEMMKIDLIGELEDRLGRALDGLQQQQEFTADALPPEGLIMADRKLLLPTRSGREQFDLIQSNMVLAGTGETAQQIFQEVFQNVIDSTDRSRGEDPTEDMLEMRWRINWLMHQLSSKYSTHVFVLAHIRMLECNPNATVVSITDVSTKFKRTGSMQQGTLQRLSIVDAERQLHEAGITLKDNVPLTRSWDWEDEETHSHSVHVLSAKKDCRQSA